MVWNFTAFLIIVVLDFLFYEWTPDVFDKLDEIFGLYEEQTVPESNLRKLPTHLFMVVLIRDKTYFAKEYLEIYDTTDNNTNNSINDTINDTIISTIIDTINAKKASKQQD